MCFYLALGEVLLFQESILNLDIHKAEFYSDFIAKKLYETNCNNEVFVLAEQKIEYLGSAEKVRSALDFLFAKCRCIFILQNEANRKDDVLLAR